MPKPRIYVETSVPSAYYDQRPQPEMVARRNWTRSWWSLESTRSTLLSSEAVLDELEAGTGRHVGDRLALVRGLALLPLVPVVAEIVDVYTKHRLMPSDPTGDALHLAIASYYGCDFLVTWNCRHLANANKFGHIRVVNTLLGLPVPALVTPLELLGGQHEAGARTSDGADG